MMNDNKRLLRMGEWLLYVIMILSFLHMADIAYDAQIQYQRMSDYAQATNMSVVELASTVNLSVRPRYPGRSVGQRITAPGLTNVAFLYNKTPKSYITVYNCSCT